MAIITLGELLHRKGGGAISAQSPLQVRQFDGSGQPIAPATETTLAALKTEVDKLAALISDGALKTALTGSTELKKASIGANVSHRWTRLVRGVNLDFAGTASPQLSPEEQVTVLDVSGPGRLILGRFLTTSLTADANLMIYIDRRQVAGSGAMWLTGFYSLMDSTRLNLDAGRTHGPWEVLVRDTNKYALGLDGSKIGPWSESFEVIIENRSSTVNVSMATLLWYAVMSSSSIVVTGSGEPVSARNVRDLLASTWPFRDDYTVTVFRSDDDSAGWNCEVFWRNNVGEQEIRDLLAREFGLS